jgi:hypothetical protein
VLSDSEQGEQDARSRSPSFGKGLLRGLAYAWASPATLIGLSLLPLNWLLKGRCRVVDGVVEIWGPLIATLLSRLPVIGSASAMTLGHVVIGVDLATLNRTRGHERVHVRQYERWGPFFIPAYFLSSFLVWCKGGHPYLDNGFEVEASALERRDRFET